MAIEWIVAVVGARALPETCRTSRRGFAPVTRRAGAKWRTPEARGRDRWTEGTRDRRQEGAGEWRRDLPAHASRVDGGERGGTLGRPAGGPLPNRGSALEAGDRVVSGAGGRAVRCSLHTEGPGAGGARGNPPGCGHPFRIVNCSRSVYDAWT